MCLWVNPFVGIFLSYVILWLSSLGDDGPTTRQHPASCKCIWFCVPVKSSVDLPFPLIKFSQNWILAVTHCGQDAIWWHRSGATLTQVMACCMTAPSHYLNQYWLTVKCALLHWLTYIHVYFSLQHFATWFWNSKPFKLSHTTSDFYKGTVSMTHVFPANMPSTEMRDTFMDSV